MKLEDQVCSLELAKRLKELGVKQESLYYWTDPCNKIGCVGEDECGLWETKSDEVIQWSAFTVAELGMMLPGYFCLAQRHIWHGKECWSFIPPIKDENGNPDLANYTLDSDTEADARAKMLIYLIENKLHSVTL